MAMMLPGWLTEALQYLGYNWPSSNEDILHANADAFRDAGREADSIIGDIEAALNHIQSNNAGEASEAFVGYMRGSDSNLSSLEDFTDAADIIAGGFDVASGAVIAFKTAVIAQLVILAAAIAASVASFGIASGAAVLAREAARRAINAALEIAVQELMG